MAMFDEFLIERWSMDEASGTRAGSVNGYDLSDSGTTLNDAGKLGDAATFGTTTWLSKTSNADLQVGGQNFLYAAWVKAEGLTNYGGFGGKWNATDREWIAFFDNVAGLHFMVNDGSDQTVNWSGTWSTGYHLTAVYVVFDGADWTANICVDNGAVDSITLAGPITSGSAPFEIGRNGEGFWELNGQVDEARIYKGFDTADVSNLISYLWNGGNGVTYGSSEEEFAIRINFHGANYTDGLGNIWTTHSNVTELNLTGSLNSYSSGAASISGTTDDELYWTQLYSFSNWTATLTVPDGNYTLELHFAEVGFSSIGARVFDIEVDGVVVVDDLDVYAEVGNFAAYITSIPVTVNGGSIDIEFVAQTDAPFCCALSLVERAFPIHWWKFDEGTGTAVADDGSIGGLPGQLTAPYSWLIDYPYNKSSAVAFSDDSFMSISGSMAEFNALSAFSVTSLVKIDTINGGNVSLLGAAGSGGWSFGVSEDYQIFFGRTVTNGFVDPNNDCALSTTVLQSGKWYRPTAVIDGLGGVKLYVDNILDATFAAQIWASGWISESDYWAYHADPNYQDDLRLYGIALSDSEASGLPLPYYPYDLNSQFQLISDSNIDRNAEIELLSESQLTVIADLTSEILFASLYSKAQLAPSANEIRSGNTDLQSKAQLLASASTIKIGATSLLTESIITSSTIDSSSSALYSKFQLTGLAEVSGLKSGSLNLFLKGEELPLATGSLDLFTYGTTTSGPLIIVDGELVEGSGINASINLFLQGATTDFVSGVLPLFIEGGTTSLSNSLDLYLHRESGIGSSLNLYISGYGVTPGAIPFSGGIPLYIERPTTAVLDMFLCVPGNPLSSGIPLYLVGSESHDSSIDLYMSGIGYITSSVKCYVNGY